MISSLSTDCTPSMPRTSFSTARFIASSRTSPVSRTRRLKLVTFTWPISPTMAGIRDSPFNAIDLSSVWAPRVRRSDAATPPITAPPTISSMQPVSEVIMAPHKSAVASGRCTRFQPGPVPNLVIHISSEQSNVDAVANAVYGCQMKFLDTCRARGRHADMHVGVGQHLADGAAVLARQCHDAHFALQRRFHRCHHVGRIARRRDGQQDIASLAEGQHLLGENLAVAVIVGDGVMIEVSVVSASAGSGKR